MQEEFFEINNDILHFIYKDSDFLIDLNQLEVMYVHLNYVVFVENGKVKTVPSSCFDIRLLTYALLDNPNFMVCGRGNIVNIGLVQSVHIVRLNDEQGLSDKYNVMLIFENRTKKEITLNSWREAERLYHEIDDKLVEIKSNTKS